MSATTLSSTGQSIIPAQFRKALHLQPGNKVSLTLEGQKRVLQRDEPSRAALIEEILPPRGWSSHLQHTAARARPEVGFTTDGRQLIDAVNAATSHL